MSGVYDNSGVHFQYPENWSILEDSQEWPHEITLTSPSGAFWALHVYFPPTDREELLSDVLRTMRLDYENIEVEAVEEEIGPVEALGYDMSFFYLDLLINSHARAFDYGDKTFLLLTQAEDRDFDQLSPIFRAITTSLLRSQQVRE